MLGISPPVDPSNILIYYSFQVQTGEVIACVEIRTLRAGPTSNSLTLLQPFTIKLLLSNQLIYSTQFHNVPEKYIYFKMMQCVVRDSD